MKWYSKLLSENIYGVGVNISMLIGGIGSVIIFPKLLGPEQFGYFSIAFAIVNFCLFFANVGMDTAVLKFISSSTVWGNTKEYLRIFSKWRYILTLATFVSIFLLSDAIAEYIFKNPALGTGIRIGSFYLLFYSLYTYYGSILTGLMKNRSFFISSVIYDFSRVVMPVLLFSFFLGYGSIIWGIVAAAIVAFLIVRKEVARTIMPDTSKWIDTSNLKSFIRYGMIGYFGTLLIQWMDSMILGIFQSSSEVAFYRVGVMLVSSVGLMIPFSQKILFPFYSEKHESQRKSEIDSIFKHTFKYGIIFALLFVLGFVLVSDYFIKFVYGDVYSASYPIIVILSILNLEVVLNSVTRPLLLGIGRIDITTKYVLIVGTVATVLNFIVAPVHGMYGVAFVTMLVRLLSILVLTHYTLRVSSIRVPWAMYSKPILCFLITLVLFYPLRPMVNSLAMGIIFSGLITIAYASLLFVTKSVTTDEFMKLIPRGHDTK